MKGEVTVKPKLQVVESEKFIKPGEVGVILEYIIKDKDGKILKRKIRQSESFVKAFLQLLYVVMGQVPYQDPYTMIGIGGGAGVDVCEGSYNFTAGALTGDDTYGILVGTDNTAVTVDNEKLNTKCADGTGTDEFQYGPMGIDPPAAGASLSQFTMTRDFVNGSGADITVYELGVYVKSGKASPNQLFCTIRDVEAGGIVVTAGLTLTVNYRIQAAV
ncbi:hypothetical protein ES703_27565 [subsurface metagenome]